LSGIAAISYQTVSFVNEQDCSIGLSLPECLPDILFTFSDPFTQQIAAAQHSFGTRNWSGGIVGASGNINQESM
jgi:hypothetical protein